MRRFDIIRLMGTHVSLSKICENEAESAMSTTCLRERDRAERKNAGELTLSFIFWLHDSFSVVVVRFYSLRCGLIWMMPAIKGDSISDSAGND